MYERAGVSPTDVWEKHQSVAPTHPDLGLSPQPRCASQPGIRPHCPVHGMVFQLTEPTGQSSLLFLEQAPLILHDGLQFGFAMIFHYFLN